MLSPNTGSFCFFFSIWIPFSFPASSASYKLRCTMQGRSSESGHPCLGFYFSGTAASLWALSIMFGVGVSWMRFVRLRKFSPMPSPLRAQLGRADVGFELSLSARPSARMSTLSSFVDSSFYKSHFPIP